MISYLQIFVVLEISDVNSVVMLLLPDISLIEEIPIEQNKNAAKAMR